MVHKFHFGAYWGPREESGDDCACRIAEFLHGLSELDPSFGQWFEQARTRKRALNRPVRFTKDYLLSLVRKGLNRRDTDHQPIPDLGFGMSLWAPLSEDDASVVRFHCGCYAPMFASGNSCILDLPKTGEAAQRVLGVDLLVNLFRLAERCFEPDWGRVASYEILEIVAAPPKHVQTGWLTYLGPNKAGLQSIDPPARLVPLVEGGQVIVAMDECPDPENPDHVEGVRKVRDTLADADLLRL